MSDTVCERTLPHNLDAERSVLGAILMQNDAFEEAARLVDQHDFYRSAHRLIFQAMANLRTKKRVIDLVTLREELTRTGDLDDVGGSAYITALSDGMPHSSHVEHYAAIVKEKSALRSLIFAGNKLLAEAYEAERPAAELLDATHQQLFAISDRALTGGFVGASELVQATLSAIEQRAADGQEIIGVPSGFTDLDAMTAGFQRGDLVVIAGRPSMGKTGLVLNIAEHVALRAGLSVGFFSLEMNKESLMMRLFASVAGLDHRRVRRGRLPDSEAKALSQASCRIGSAALAIDDSSALTVYDVRAKARALKASKGLDLIIIDYLQLMTGSAKAETKNLEVAAITKGLKGVAKDLNVPVLLLSQLSREPEKRGNHRPQLSDLRDSGCIEQDADLVIFIHREEYYAPTDENRGLGELIASKQRNGPTGAVRVTFQDHLVRFGNAAPDYRRAHVGVPR